MRRRSSRPAPDQVTGAPIALSLGDPAGIGAEIVAGAWTALHDGPLEFLVVGDADLIAATGASVARIATPTDVSGVFAEAIPVLHRPCAVEPTPGHPDPANARCVIDWITEATRLVQDGQARALVTCPIAKAPLYRAGFRFAGHTEFVEALTSDLPFEEPRGPVMMLTAADLRVCLLTIHVPLRDVAALITPDRLIRTARVTHRSLQRDFGIARPRLALAGLNPHAGEDGTLGTEERDLLLPTVRRLRQEGIDISDPRPADTMFHPQARQTYDAAICAYHDQGLIPVKTIDFWGGVNATLGLPIIRTSPDHGVGFDIAGQGQARPDSLIAAISLAAQMAECRARP